MLWLLLAAVVPGAWADEADERMAKLKTAYLFNIAKFVRWPESNESIRLCIQASSQLLPVATQITGRELGDGRVVTVVEVVQPEISCHVYFGSGTLLASVPGNGPTVTLTVGDGARALEQGFAIQLFMQRDKLRFAVNRDRIQDAPFQISSNLLRLARSPG